MRIFILLALLGSQVAFASAVRAQCVVLSDLLAIGADPSAQVSGKVVTDHLSPEWVYAAPTPTAREASWAWQPAGATAATARLLVRPQRPGQDVVLKTAQANCVRDLRSELKARKLASQPVTCPNCEAVRYQAADFEVTLYSQMKGEFPFVVVVHQVPAGMTPAAAAGAIKGNMP